MKKNTFAFVGILAVLLMSLGMVSAVSLSNIAEISSPTSVSHDDGSFEIVFSLTNGGVEGTIYDLSNFTSSQAGLTSSFNDTSMANGSGTAVTETITATISFDKHQSGTITGNINVGNDATATDETFAFSVAINSTPELTIALTTSLSKTENGTITVTNTGNVDLTGINLVSTTTADFTVQFNPATFNLIAGESKPIVVFSEDAKNLDFRDDSSLDVKATNGSISSDAVTLSVNNLFYDGENQGDLKVVFDSISVEEGFGDDEDYWYPFDKIELSIEIENNGGSDVEDIELQICLLDVGRGTCILDEDDMDVEENDFDLDAGDNKNIIVTFEIDPNDLKEGNTEYELYASVVGKIDDSDSQYDENKTGHSVLQKIEIRTDEEFIIIDQITLTDLSSYLNEDEASCGSEVMISAKVWNIGDKDIEDDEIFVRIYNKALGVNKLVSFDNGINSMDWELLEMTITVPSDAQEQTYSIQFTAYDDENFADKYIYENKEDDRSEFSKLLKVTDCGGLILTPTVSANLESVAEMGTELVVKATISNNDEDNDFIISVSDFDTWATLVSATPQMVSLDKGESAVVTITFNPTATGAHSFKINTIVDGESYSQLVSVNIKEPAKSQFFAGLDNTILYIIVGALVLLILISIILIARVSRRRAKPEF
ncbi:MAG: putative S-layer protein [archaeon]